MNFELYAKVKMNRPIDKRRDHLSAGGYSILSNCVEYPFDFSDYAIEIDKNDASIIHINGWNPDYDTFPLVENITPEVLRNMTNIIEFFIYTGEPDEDGAIPIELLECQFDFPSNGEVIEVPESICKGAYITRGI